MSRSSRQIQLVELAYDFTSELKALGLKPVDYMLAQAVKQEKYSHIRAVGGTKRSLLVALVLSPVSLRAAFLFWFGAMRRGPGLAGLMKGREQQSALSAVGEQMEADKTQQATALLQSLQTALQSFAAKHRSRINSDPKFRQSFCEMCMAVGVDPLSSSKGLWDELLGVGQFYNDLSVQ
ncbi:unnamed protein product, partial [Effrenium voratum]